ncbi:MAG: citrate/2-methylcitrate synthase [Candidatus Eiseniibacteriota bacterium]|jgi:citrate synthase
MQRFETHARDFDWRAERLEWPLAAQVGPGLAGAIACDTAISWVDAARGALYYRGIPIADIAARYDLEQVAYLLIDGRRPEDDPESLAAFRRRLADSRALPQNVVDIVRSLPPDTHPTRLLRAGVSALGCFELTADDDLSGTVIWEDLRIVGQMAELVRVVTCHVAGLEHQPTDFSTTLAQGVIQALEPRCFSDDEVRLLDLCWVLYADHGLDAPTFTGMVVGSCRSDPYYDVVAGLCALRGPLLGGAGEQVLRQLLPLADPDAARAWVAAALARGERIAGFGHRVFHGVDPRVAMLRDEARRLAAPAGRQGLFDVASAVEEETTRRLAARGLATNANFYAAIVYHLLGARPSLVPCLYAVGRVVGIVARVREYLEHNRLFRPESRYVGPPPRPYVPISARSRS